MSATTRPDPWAYAADIFDPPDPTNIELEPHQIPPSDPASPSYDPDLGPAGWFCWLLLAGRGAGKTHAASVYVSRYARRFPNTRISIIAPTLGDARKACVDGPSGLLAIDPTVKVRKTPDYYLEWQNGSRADVFGASTPEDVERLRAGGNRHLVWAEELAAWRHLQDAWDQMEFGLRLGTHPHVVASTTPKNRALIKRLVADPKVITTHATTMDNPHLHDTAKDRLQLRYKGTRLGRQELLGEILEDVEGALWSRELLEQTRIPEDHPALKAILAMAYDPKFSDPDPKINPLRANTKTAERAFLSTLPHLEKIVIGVDPQAVSKPEDTATAHPSETGIVVVARLSRSRPCPFPHGEVNEEEYKIEHTTRQKRRGRTKALTNAAHGGHTGCLVVLEDASLNSSPQGWASRTMRAYHTWQADGVIAEINHGGDMVTNTLLTNDPNVPVKVVRASRGKAIRAEPVAALYAQRRVHHTTDLEQLEDQMTTWEPDAEWSPDRMDGVVWACTELGVEERSHLTLVGPDLVGESSQSYWRGAG